MPGASRTVTTAGALVAAAARPFTRAVTERTQASPGYRVVPAGWRVMAGVSTTRR
jgi:hypothetical protein